MDIYILRNGTRNVDLNHLTGKGGMGTPWGWSLVLCGLPGLGQWHKHGVLE